MNRDQLPTDIHCFEPSSDFAISHGHLPHWHQAGTICFITWRTWDSMPQNVLDQWAESRDEWLTAKGINTQQPNWRERLGLLTIAERKEYRSLISNRWDANLDNGYGSCPLADPVYAGIVANSLLHFDGDRYLLSDFVIMPNHVHLLAAFVDEQGMTTQCESWKHFTATRINRILKRTGRFWETESFDHLVRSDEQYEHLRRYIASNPKKAGLRDGQFVLFSRGFVFDYPVGFLNRDALPARGASGLP